MEVLNDKVTLWGDPDSLLLNEYDEFAKELMVQFPTAIIKPQSYSGGVPGMRAQLPIEQYAAVKEWLTRKYGLPNQVERWHPSHTKTVLPLRFEITEAVDSLKMDHVNLISMMQRKSKRFTLVTWM
jgi:hypothetical protein